MQFTLHVGELSSAGIPIGDKPLVIGRSRSADVVVADPRVSRRHVELRVQGDRVHAAALAEASPFSFAGRARRKAELAAGDRLVIGDTVLAISADRDVVRKTATRTRRGGVADEARALAAITDLVQLLDQAESIAASERAVQEWGIANLGATKVIVAASSAAGASAIVEAAGAGRWIVVETRDAPTAVVRGLVAVAAKLFESRVATLERTQSVLDENVSLRTAAIGSAREFLGLSKAAALVSTQIAKLARSDAAALVVGESGTGKTFAARLIHEASARAKHPLRIINCAAIPESLLEAELFGAERGAFSGAVATRVGAFEAVGKGTLVLDEIGELDITRQAKLLHVLEERSFERLGSNQSYPLEARVIAATNRDLGAMIEEGTFRRDLYFRISVVTLSIPPLRDRGDDVLTLAQRILADLVRIGGRRVDGFTNRAAALLRRYPWPGNVRELRNVVEHALVLGEGRLIDVDDLPERLVAPTSQPSPTDRHSVRLPARLDWLEAQAIEAALRATAGNRTKAAAILGINRVTLQKKLGSRRSGSHQS